MAPLLPSSTPLAETIWRLEVRSAGPAPCQPFAPDTTSADCPVKRIDPKEDMESKMHMQPANHLEGGPSPSLNKVPTSIYCKN